MRRGPFGLTLLLIALLAGPAVAQPFDGLSARNASYTIQVTLDTETRHLVGRQVLEWRNIQEQPTDELWFHLYWNAWRNTRSTWMLEDRISGRSDLETKAIREEDWGWIEVDSVRWLPAPAEWAAETDLPTRFESPDDDNPDDRTVLVADLPVPVQPGQTIRVELTWHAKVPRTFARTGYRGDFYFLAHWFPKLGVFEEEGWNCHQFHSSTEFYSDYGVYDVKMTVPERFVLGATGREVERRDNGDGTVTHRYYQEDVHAFTWTASPHYVVLERRFDEPGLPPVDMRLLIQPEHRAQADRHFDAASAALGSYGNWYGPYPYGHVTVVDPAYQSGASGMEYPTLFTCGTRRFNPFGGDQPESVTIHEMGHQFWYGIVGNNEFEHAWLDEGLNTFSTIRTLETEYDDRILVKRYLKGYVPVRFPDIKVPRWKRRLERYRLHATSDVPATPSYRYFPSSGKALTYDKTALWLATLERHLGWPTLRAILSEFFQRHAFDHPTPDDFIAVANEVAGQDLSWFFDQVHRGSERFDYGIVSVSSFPAAPKGWIERDGELVYVERDSDEDTPDGGTEQAGSDDGDDEIYRTEVVVRRWGSGRFPVDVVMVFEDGHRVRESWDGQDRWKLWAFERASKLDYAEVDPDRVLMLDADRANNSKLREPEGRLPAVKWGSKWMVWFQDVLSHFAFFI